jgi:hypothetical protein
MILYLKFIINSYIREDVSVCTKLNLDGVTIY